MKKLDLRGKRYGRLMVVADVGRSASGKVLWQCACDCGRGVIVLARSLTREATRSCGCYYIETRPAGPRLYRAHRRAYNIWSSMKDRCLNPRSGSYRWYGARGITVCDRWIASFANFLSDMGDPPHWLSLDRRDNEGPYALWNCRWATDLQQANNTRKNVLIRFGDETLSAAGLARRVGLPVTTIYSRINKAVAVRVAEAKERLGFVS